MKIDSAQNMQKILNANASARSGTSNSQKKLKSACQDFEALFIAHMLKKMRSASDTGDGLFGKGLGGDLFQDLFDAEIARSMASQRGLGMAEQLYDKLLEKGLLPESISGGSASGKVNAFEQIRQFDAAISTAASAHEVEPALIYAVIQAESGGNPHAVSMKGAKGLMQLMDGTAREMGVANVFQPRQNIDGGVQYLKAMLARFDGDTSKALAAYNAGPGTVESYGGVPPFKETQKYVEHVMELLEFYRQQLDQSGQS